MGLKFTKAERRLIRARVIFTVRDRKANGLPHSSRLYTRIEKAHAWLNRAKAHWGLQATSGSYVDLMVRGRVLAVCHVTANGTHRGFQREF
jgi:hypothetical protein